MTMNTHNNDYRQIVCLDFDGVLHSYDSGWKGIDVIPDPPVDGAFDMLKEYIKYFRVHIYSSRSKTPKGIHAMIAWFIDHGFEYCDQLTFDTEKPPAFITIDDRAICFRGTFPSVQEIKNFKPWNKK